MFTRESIKEGVQKALKEKPDSTALAVSVETVTMIHGLLDGDPDYEYCDDDDYFESKLFGLPLIAAENIKDGIIAPVIIADPDTSPSPEEIAQASQEMP